MTAATLTPIRLPHYEWVTWRELAGIAREHPEAVTERAFLYMKPGSGFPEMVTPALHVEANPYVVVIPIEPLACEVRCDICKERPNLGDLCPVCRGTKRRTMTVGDVQRFVDAGDRYGMSGTFWKMAPLGAWDR